MNPREAVKGTIQFILSNLIEEQKLKISRNTIYRLVEELHDDVLFLEKLQEFVEEYLNDFGVNYDI